MNFSLRTKLIFAFGLLVVVSVLNSGFLWLTEKNAAEQQFWVMHTHQVISGSDNLLGHLRDAETGQRGFLLTRRIEYLEPYNNGVSASKSDIDALGKLIQDNPLQQSRLGVISTAVNNKLSELNETIQLAQQGEWEKALAIVRGGEGKKIMDDLRGHLAQFKTEEEFLLETRTAGFNAELSTMRTLFIAEAVMFTLLVFGIAFLVQRHLVVPIIQLTRNSDKLAAGGEIEAVRISNTLGRDEMNQLVEAFNGMARTIRETVEELTIARQESEENEQRLSEIIRGTNIGTWEWNVQSGELRVNERWLEILGYIPGELNPLNGDTLRNTCHPDDVDLALGQLQKNLSGELDYFECETRRRSKNDTWVWVQDRGKIVEWTDDGKPFRMSGTMADISLRKEVERVKSEFVSTVSHELRTPLTSIKGSLGLIRSGAVGALQDDAQSMLEIAYTNTDRLVLLINDLLDMEKINSGDMVFKTDSIDLTSLLNEAVEANKGYAVEHNVTFICQDNEDGIQIEGDRHRLMQVLTNLMSNAAKFSRAGGRIEMSTMRDNDTVRVAVRDFGVGIPEEFQEHLFDKFTQADSSDTRQKGGTGLGLSISKAIIEKHNGAITFETETGVGSTFTVELPVLVQSDLAPAENLRG